MKLNHYISILISISFLLFIFSCNKNLDSTPIPPVVPSDTTNPNLPNVDSLKDLNKWECEVDGVLYGGSIDTSFFKISDPGTNYTDTLIECSGTTYDKKSNIYFSVPINRTRRTNVFSSAFLSGSTTVFDTSSVNYLIHSRGPTGSEMKYVIDSFKSNRLLISFRGKLISGVSDVHTVNKGKISCYLGTGNSEPKKFKFKNDQANYFGSVTSAEIISNTMVIDFLPFVLDADNRFRLSVRTGGTIKPGIYDSKKGDVSLEYYVPSIHWFYADDEYGDVRLVIHSINQDIVHGSFSGTAANGKNISGGEFTVRVKRYLPVTDSVHHWKFVSDEGLTTYSYPSILNLFGGNIVKATLSKNSFKHLLTIDGESDQGSSSFKLVISSFDPIKKGVYEAGLDPADKLDSLKFNSNQKLWNGYSTELFSDQGRKAYCKIDSIDGQKVFGTFWGSINRRTSPYSTRGVEIRQGFFMAKF